MAATKTLETIGATRFEAAMAWLASFTDWEQLVQTAPARATFDLERMRRILDLLDRPERGRPSIHVTGTKGKTSVTWMAEALLRAHGKKTFRFISPHVEHVRERLAIDGEDVSGEVFADLAQELRDILLGANANADVSPGLPSFFEATTAMGFLLARKAGASTQIIEVGLGGRLDATNVIEPAASVITSIGLDHCRILGSTRALIATEKAGILKPGRPAITGLTPGDPAFDVINARARELGCPLRFPGSGLRLFACSFERRPDGGPALRFTGSVDGFQADGFRLRAGAPHQALNALLALAAVKEVLALEGRSIDAEIARAALERVAFPARAEWIPGAPPVLLDGAHTHESIRDLAEVAEKLAHGRPIHLLVGLTRDRDPALVFAPLLSKAASISTTVTPTPRARGAFELLDALRAGPVPGAAYQDVEDAFAAVKARAGPGGIVVVTGSLYLAGAVRTLAIGGRSSSAAHASASSLG